ncbi:MAG: Mur ligase domain-containing protein, partial [Longimicrobiales bacterium]
MSAGVEARGLPPAVVTGVTADSRQVRPGNVFVAVRGTRTDGHDFLGGAVERGAAVCVVEREVHTTRGVPVVVVEDTRRTLALLAAAFFGHPGRRVPLIGITGTVGKTSVLSMLEAILVAADARPASIGSLGMRVGGQSIDATQYTTPDAVRLQDELASVVGAGCDV